MALLQPSAARLHEADHRRTRLAGEPHHADDGLGVRLAQRTAHEARVLRVAEDGTATDAPGAGEHAVPGQGSVAGARRDDARAQGAKRAGVAERLEPFERRQALLAGGIRASARCGGDGHSGASMQSTTLCPPKPNEFEIATGARPLRSIGRDSPGT